LALDPLLLTTSIAILGVVSAVGLVYSVRRRPKGNEKMISIWRAIIEGSNAYLKRQFRTIAVIAILLALIIVGAFSLTAGVGYGVEISLSFLLGVAFSLTAAYIAMRSTTNANVRCTEPAAT